MKIEVVPYRPKWPEAFEYERNALLELGIPGINSIEHIGSTAVQGLAAKPIIDIMIEIQSLEALDKQREAIERLGYEALGAFGIEGRRYFRKGGEARTHQIHAFESFDPNLARHLAFRDYLRQSPSVRKEYGDLKIKIASQCDQDIDRYCHGKDDFIKSHEAQALEWMNSKGQSSSPRATPDGAQELDIYKYPNDHLPANC